MGYPIIAIVQSRNCRIFGDFEKNQISLNRPSGGNRSSKKFKLKLKKNRDSSGLVNSRLYGFAFIELMVLGRCRPFVGNLRYVPIRCWTSLRIRRTRCQHRRRWSTSRVLRGIRGVVAPPRR